MSIFNTDDYKFNKYCEWYSEFFDSEKPIFSKNNYSSLIDMIRVRFDDMDKYKRVNKEIILKDKFDEWKDSDAFNLIPIIVMFLAVIGSLIVASYKDPKYSFDFNYFFILLVIGIVYFIYVEFKNYRQKVCRRGFYLMCLNILDKINSEIFDDKEYKLDKILENTEQLKKFHGIE